MLLDAIQSAIKAKMKNTMKKRSTSKPSLWGNTSPQLSFMDASMSEG